MVGWAAPGYRSVVRVNNQPMPNSVPGKPIILVKFIADYQGVLQGVGKAF